MDSLYDEFGRLLRAVRERAQIDLTQQELANRVGLSRTSVTNIELGKQHISLHMIYGFAKALGVSPTELLPDSRFAEIDNTLQTQISSLPISERNKQLLQKTISSGTS